MKTPPYLYHAASRGNLQSIASKGLIATKDPILEGTKYANVGVNLLAPGADVFDVLGQDRQIASNIVMIKVATVGLTKQFTNLGVICDAQGWWRYAGSIPLKNLAGVKPYKAKA